MLQKSRQDRLGGDIEKALERNRLDDKHHGPLFQGFGSVSAESV